MADQIGKATPGKIQLVAQMAAFHKGDYVTHALRGTSALRVYAACGRTIKVPVQSCEGDAPTCHRCQKALTRPDTQTGRIWQASQGKG